MDSEIRKENRGAFVILKTEAFCGGVLVTSGGVKPLWETVQEMAAAAAFHDPRFPSVRVEELKDLSH